MKSYNTIIPQPVKAITNHAMCHQIASNECGLRHQFGERTQAQLFY